MTETVLYTRHLTDTDDNRDFLDLLLKDEANTETCEEYLNKCPEAINCINRRGETPLHIAAKNPNDSTMVSCLLKFQPNINAKNFWGQTPLHYAAEALAVGNLEILLQQDGVDLTITDVNGYTILHSFINLSFSWALSPTEEWKKGIQALVASGVDINSQTNYGHSILHLVSKRIESNKFLKCILENCESMKLDLRNSMKQTFLHSYLVSSITTLNFYPFSSIRTLDFSQKWLPGQEISKISELLNQKDITGISPLFMLFSSNTFPNDILLKYLLELGGSVRSVDNLGNTVLHFDGVREELIENHADVNATNIYGISAASMGGFSNLRMVNNFALRDRWHRTPMFIMLNNVELFRTECSETSIRDMFDKFLTDLSVNGKGFSVNDQDMFGSTLLHLAAYHDDAGAVEILLRHGANPDILDDEMDKPVDTAVRFGNFKCFPIFPNKTEVPKHLTKYSDIYKSRDTVFVSDVGDINCLHKLVRSIPKDTEAFSKQLLLKHHINFANEAEEANQVTSAVYELVSRISASVSDLDNRFKISVLRTGSSAESTKVGRPDEFDFVLCLETLNSVCEIEMSTYPEFEKLACLKFKDQTVPENFVSFSDEDGYFVSQPYLNYLFRYIQKSLYQKELWEKGQLIFQGKNEELGFQAPVINLTVFWVGSRYKYMKISIDLVPAVYKKGWWPPGYLPSNVSDAVKNAGCLVLLESKTRNMKIDHIVMNDSIVNDFLLIDEKSKHKPRTYRISVAPAEIALMKNLPENFRKAYALSKMFKSSKFTPVLVIDQPVKLYKDTLFDSDDDGIEPAKDIKSYWIKNCVFYVADRQKELLEMASPFTLSIQVYKQLLEFAKAGVFRPYLQQSTNLFNYQYEVDIIEDGNNYRTFDRTIFRQTCLYRKMCVDMVLGVLRCRMPAENNVKWLDLCELNYRKQCTPNAIDMYSTGRVQFYTLSERKPEPERTITANGPRPDFYAYFNVEGHWVWTIYFA